MGREERQTLISEIESIHGSKVITYFISTKQGIRTKIDDVIDLRELYDHLIAIGQTDRIDLVIYSFGGDATVAWALSNLIREFTKDFSVLVPSFAFSCATSIALGANKIIMGKMGTLGPVDPTVSNEFNPIIRGNITPISVEDVAGYISLLKDKIDIRDEKNFTDVVSRLCMEVHPLALGNAFRQYIKARDDARKLLELHMNPKEQDSQIKSIVETLVEKLYFHGHHIPRTEAGTIGLNVVNAETINHNGRDLDRILWDLYLDYEKELDLQRPYEDEVPEGNKRILPLKFVESAGKSSAMIIRQEYIKPNVPNGTFFTQLTNQSGTMLALAIPTGNQVQVIPYVPTAGGKPIMYNGIVYEKKEISFWKKFDTDEDLYRA